MTNGMNYLRCLLHVEGAVKVLVVTSAGLAFAVIDMECLVTRGLNCVRFHISHLICSEILLA